MEVEVEVVGTMIERPKHRHRLEERTKVDGEVEVEVVGTITQRPKYPSTSTIHPLSKSPC